MKELSTCLALVRDIDDDQRDELLARVDEYRAAGMGAAEAQRAAVADMTAENEDELAELDRLARAQHPDAFMPEELVAERRARFFTNPDEYRAPQFSRRQVDRGMEQWAAKVMAGDTPREPFVPISLELPHRGLEMGGFGRSRGIILTQEAIRHLNNKGRVKTGLVTAQDIGALPELVKHPRAVAHYEDIVDGKRVAGLNLILDARDSGGRPLFLGLRPDTAVYRGTAWKVTTIKTLFGADNSLAKVLRLLRDGKIVWMRDEEVARVRDFTSGASIARAPGSGPAEGAPPRTALAAPQPNRAEVSQATTASVYADQALARYEAGDQGWQSSRESIPVSEADIGRAVEAGVQFSRRQAPQSEEFRRWFGKSTIVDAEGQPRPMYHGTAADIEAFRPKQAGAIFFTDRPRFAWDFANASLDWMKKRRIKERAENIIPVYVRAENPFDFRKPEHVKAVAARMIEKAGRERPDGKLALFDGDKPTLNTREVLEDLLANEHSNWTTMEMPLTQETIRELGHDGFYVAEGGVHNLGVYDPKQVKSAVGNRGTFDPDDPRLHYSRRQPAGPHKLREFGPVARLIEAVQDRYNRWKHATQDVQKTGGTLTEANDFYAAEERYWGIVGTELEDFGKEVEEFTKAVAKDKLTLEDVATYAYAQHAKERNAYIAARRPTMPDGGSGMTDAEAQAFLDDAAYAGLDVKLQQHADTLRRWSEQTRDLLLRQGLITQDEHNAWSAMFANYVPLRGLDGVSERKGTGQGFNVRGAESKRAFGRRSEAKQIIEQIIQDRSRAAIRAGKNNVLRSFLQFVLDNASANLWQVNAVETKPVERIDAAGNRVIEEDQRVISDDRTVTVKDGGREVHILVNDERLRTQLQNLHVEQIGTWLGSLLWANRLMGKLYTALSPVFTVINGARDLQAASAGMIDEIGFMAVPKLWAKMPRSVLSAWSAELLGRPSTEYQLYRATGGKTGFFDFKDIDRQTAELRELLADAERSWVNPKKLWQRAGALIDGLNAGIENATRFASFQVARESGLTTAQAARVSKNITVNFNRKGALTPALSAWFLFFNPAVQGTARLLQALRSPKVLATIGAGMTGIAALAMRNASMGEDDDGIPWWDKIPDEVKERNLIIMLPPGASGGEEVPGSKVGRYVKVPMPYGYNFFAVVANQAVDVWRNMQNPNHGRTPMRATAKAFNAFVGAWLPASELSTGIENSKSLVMLAVPDALNPLAQGAMNVNSFGRQLYPDDRASEALPDSQRYFAGQAGTIFQRAAEGLNTMSGGSRFSPGLVDITPAQLENLARGYGGGPVSFGLDLLNALYVRQSIERPTLAANKLPFAKQLYGVIDAETDRLMGYERLEDVETKAARVERARKEGDREEALALRGEYGAISQIGNAAESAREQLANLRKLELKVLAKEEWSEAERYAKLVEINEKRRLALQAFNRVYARALEIDAQR